MSIRAASWLAWSLCLLSVALTGLGLLLLILNRSHQNVHIFDYWALLTVVTLASLPVGAVIASRRPENPIGWILCVLGLNSAVEHFASQYATYTLLAEPDSLPGGAGLDLFVVLGSGYRLIGVLTAPVPQRSAAVPSVAMVRVAQHSCADSGYHLGGIFARAYRLARPHPESSWD